MTSNEKLDQERIRSRKALEEERQRHCETTGKLKTLAQVIVTVRNDLKASRNATKDAELEKQDLKAAHESFKRTTDSEMSQIRTKLEHVESQRHALQTTIGDLQTQLKEAHRANDEKTHEHSRDIAEKKSQILSQVREIAGLERKITNSARIIDNFKVQLSEVRQASKKHRGEILSLEEQLVRANHDLAFNESRFQKDLRKLNKKLERQESVLKEQNEKLAAETKAAREYAQTVQEQKLRSESLSQTLLNLQLQMNHSKVFE